MADEVPQFYRYPQSEALSEFLPILKPYLPFSNGVYNRIRAPLNLPSRHCLFAATFPAPSPGSISEVPDVFTIVFADRSRHAESQIWIFNPLITQPSPLSRVQQAILTTHLTATVRFLKDTKIPEAPGWPFSPVLRFACLHEYMSTALQSIAEARDALVRATHWNLWNISTSTISSSSTHRRAMPEGFTVGRVPEDQLDIVLSTSSIERQPSTMLALPNVGIFNETKRLVAWGYIGIDGGFVTLYVLEEHRGKGLATSVAVELLSRLEKGDFVDLGFDGSSGWVQSGVYAGNAGSEGVMASLGGKIGWTISYIWVDSGKF